MNFLKSATFLVIIATLTWGASPAIMKLTLQEVPPFTLAFIRMFCAAVVLGCILHKNLKIKKLDLKTFTIAAFTGVTLNIGFFFMGLKFAPAINAAILVASVPIFTLIGAHFYLKEKFSLKLIAGSLLALIGVLIIVGIPSAGGGALAIFGSGLLLMSSVVWVFHEIYAKKLFKKYDPSLVAFYSMFIGSLPFLPLAMYELATRPNWYANVTSVGLWGILYGIFGGSLLAYWAWQKGLAKMPAGHASFFFYIDPISGAILAVILLGEIVTPQLIIGGALIATAVGLIEIHRKNHPLHRN